MYFSIEIGYHPNENVLWDLPAGISCQNSISIFDANNYTYISEGFNFFTLITAQLPSVHRFLTTYDVLFVMIHEGSRRIFTYQILYLIQHSIPWHNISTITYAIEIIFWDSVYVALSVTHQQGNDPM